MNAESEMSISSNGKRVSGRGLAYCGDVEWIIEFNSFNLQK